ncbi:MAG: RNA methyltransferase [Eubacterium sp.]|nr:RNA methyltransferase [Eubacterium sp.]
MEITSRQNALVKDTVRLKQKKYRDREDLYFFEGLKLFEEALAWKIPLKRIFVTPDRMAALSEDLRARLTLACPEYHLVSQPVMEALSEQKMPEGILCVARKNPADAKIFDNFFKKSGQKLQTCVILEDVQDPGNVGTIIRTADAAGFDLVICSRKSADIYSGKVQRAAMGSLFHLPVVQTEDLEAALLTLKARGLFLLGSALSGQTSLPEDLGRHGAVGLILGNESKGMSEALGSHCDALYKIPMYGSAESLNVSVASGILMYDLARSLRGL